MWLTYHHCVAAVQTNCTSTIESAITWFDGDTAVITGPIFAADGSMERYLEVAGTRPDPDEKSPPSEHMFPITNTFYRNAVALAAGGFADSFDSQSGPRLGWDTELAWRLRRLGWNSRFREEVYQFRVFPRDAANAGWPRREMRIAAQVPMLLARAPEYANRTLVSGIFVSRQTMYFDLAAAGIALAAARRQRRWLLVAAPWVGTVSSRIDVWPVRNWPHSAKTVAGIGARQGLWLAGFVVGSIKARRIAL